jgi:hypothetical protein
MPFKTVLDIGESSIKSNLLLEMQLKATMSTQMGRPPREKFMIFDEVAKVDCQALK